MDVDRLKGQPTAISPRRLRSCRRRRCAKPDPNRSHRGSAAGRRKLGGLARWIRHRSLYRRNSPTQTISRPCHPPNRRNGSRAPPLLAFAPPQFFLALLFQLGLLRRRKSLAGADSLAPRLVWRAGLLSNPALGQQRGQGGPDAAFVLVRQPPQAFLDESNR